MKHHLRMLLGCVLPMALIFILPSLGVGQGVSLFVFVILMFGCHLMMMGGHGGHAHSKTDKESKNEQH